MAYRLLDRTGDSGCTYDSTPTPDEIDLTGTDVNNLRSFADAVSDGDLADGDETTITVYDASGNWKTCHVTLVTGTPDVLQVDEVIASEGTIADEATVTVYAVTSQDNLKGLLLTETATVTTGDVSAVVGKRYELDISGMTADRNFVLPSASAGDEIEVMVSTDAPASYELIVKGDTGVSLIFAGSTYTATEMTRMFIRGETLRFKYGEDSVWYLKENNLLAQYADLSLATSITVNSAATVTRVAYDTNSKSLGCTVTTGASCNVVVRRTGWYDITQQLYPAAAPAANDYYDNRIYDGSSTLLMFGREYLPTNDQHKTPNLNGKLWLTAGTEIRPSFQTESANTGVQNSATGTFFHIFEIMSSSNVGPGVLLTADETITTGDHTAALNTQTRCDISGMTADRNFVIPAGSSDGDWIEVLVTTDAASGYEFIVKGDTGVTLVSGGTTYTATEMTRMFIRGESIRFYWNATDSAWYVNQLNLIPQQFYIADSWTHTSSGSWEVADWSGASPVTDTGSIADVANDKATLRRTGNYQINAHARQTSTTDQKLLAVKLQLNSGDIEHEQHGYSTSSGSNPLSAWTQLDNYPFSAGDDITVAINQDDSASEVMPWTLSITELLPSIGGLGAAKAGIENLAPTTGTVTAVTNMINVVDMSGMTADRAIKLPAGAFSGDFCTIVIEDEGDYEGTLTGDTGVSIIGWGQTFSAGTTARRLHSQGQALTFVSDGSNTWMLSGASMDDDWIEYSTATLTTADLSAVAGYHYRVNPSGITANRNIVLPANGAEGEKITFYLNLDCASGYSLIVKGDTGVTVRMGQNTATAAEVGRLVLKGESVTFVSTSGGDWEAVDLNLIATHGTLTLSTDITTNSATTWERIQFDTSDTRGITATTGATAQLAVRRPGLYLCTCSARLNSAGADGDNFGIYLDGSTVGIVTRDVDSLASATATTWRNVNKVVELAAGEAVRVYMYHTQANRGINDDATFDVVEIL